MRQSSRRNFGRRDFCHIEQLESRAVLSAVSVAIVPPAVQDDSIVVAPRVATTFAVVLPKAVPVGVPV
ncbi:MAG: hypothetical protein ACKOWG_05700, partial [Planctomycetia bacterium]